MQWFEVALVVLTLVTGAIWLLDKLVLVKSRQNGNTLAKEQPILVEYAKAFFPVLAVVLCLRSFIGAPYRVVSGSMIPTLFIGDFMLVDKFSYGLRLPITNQKFLPVGEPKRGDVVLFKPTQGPGDQDWVKRVIGLPGDTVAYRDHQVYVNGKQWGYHPQSRFVGAGLQAEASGSRLLTEDLPGRSHPSCRATTDRALLRGKASGQSRREAISSWVTTVTTAMTPGFGVSFPTRTCAARRC